MKSILASLLLFFTFSGNSQNYPAGQRTVTFYDDSRSNRAVATDLYYPGASAGINVPVAPGTEKFPVVVFGHGFVLPASSYRWLADSLVKYGFIVAFPATESSFSPSHEQFGRDIAFLCRRIISLNDSSSSFLSGRVRDKSAAAGHSMGGGCSFLAMTYNSNITALFNFAAAETTPSAKTAALSVSRPALVFSGSSDCIVAPAQQQDMYTNIPYPCKTYININDGLHCQFANNDATCVLGQVTTGCNTSSVTSSVVFQKICFLLVPFLKYYLRGDCSAGAELESNYNSLAGVSRLRTCTSDPLGCVVTGVNNVTAGRSILIYPSPAVKNGMLFISSEREIIQSIVIFDESGRKVEERKNLSARTISIAPSQSGVLLLRVVASGKIYYRRVIVL